MYLWLLLHGCAVDIAFLKKKIGWLLKNLIGMTGWQKFLHSHYGRQLLSYELPEGLKRWPASWQANKQPSCLLQVVYSAWDHSISYATLPIRVSIEWNLRRYMPSSECIQILDANITELWAKFKPYHNNVRTCYWQQSKDVSVIKSLK